MTERKPAPAVEGEEMGQNMDPRGDPLGLLQVFDRLEVGPVKVETSRLTAPYRLVSNGKVDQTELTYRYEEEVFDPADSASCNLAGMVAAQVALNYGLFCGTILFHGIYDETDRRFLKDMAENTAREVYVKKFLEPNPFLLGEVAHPPTVKMRSYLRAGLEFSDETSRSEGTSWQSWAVDNKRHAVLSSGGKDSLLTYGLIHELDREVHPIFLNESGRHWFTALNAYNSFKKSIPNTSRVWTNADRVFAWMLRHMPFIRKDFAQVRSDEYPIRLWTVAVFLFGALPLLRKRRIGRLLIGDEYDTTRRTSWKGITHYDGLYDQSRHFDNALSRYYLRKGWSVSQFSILRPLSELLIEKVLVERYPDLQKEQMSCHAAHKEGPRIAPCGKCEKCRRIVGMLLALEADPRHCGYTDRNIRESLKGIVEKGVHQESRDAEQLYLMLLQKGLIELSVEKRKNAKEHPEILKVRFDSERAPLDGIPLDLRDPLYRIFKEHALGACKKSGRTWVESDPLRNASLKKPYAFELSLSETKEGMGKQRKTPSEKYVWGELTWPEAEERLKKVDIALLPVGSTEQHGPHLPLDTDAFDADYLARRVVEACSDPKPLVLPGIPYGVSYHHHGFPGTISIRNDTLSRLTYEIGMSVAQNGIKKLVIINGHGGNTPALNNAAQMINQKARIFVCVDTGETSDVDINEITETPNDVHAGEIETSTSLAVRPHLVRMDRAVKRVPHFSNRYLDFTSRRGVAWYAYTKKLSSSGVMGDPTKANAEKGRKMWEVMIAHLVALVEDLKNMTLDEIHQRRY